MADPDSIYACLKKLLALRKSTPELLDDANLEFLYPTDVNSSGRAFAYKRGDVTVIVNPDENAQKIPLDISCKEVLFKLGDFKQYDGLVELLPQSFVVMR